MPAASARDFIDSGRHPIESETFAQKCREVLDDDGAVILSGFFTEEAISRVVSESTIHEAGAFYAESTHNVYLTPNDPTLPPDHSFNRQVQSSKGLIADDEIPADSRLRAVYEDVEFRRFLCRVLDIDEIHPYDDDLSSINVHFASAGRELGWHFDNSSFAVTMLLQAPTAGGVFEFVPGIRDAEDQSSEFERVDRVLDGTEPVRQLRFEPGDLVLFRGRNALHRVTPTDGPVTRMLVVFAFNDRPNVSLSPSALRTFYGRTSSPGRAMAAEPPR